MSTPAPRPGSRAPRARVGLAALALAVPLAACSDDGSDAPGSPTVTAGDPAGAERPGGGPPEVVGTVASGLAAPWGLAFLPDGSAVVTERDTRRVLRVVPGPEGGAAGEAEVRELGTLDAAAPRGEAGALGVAVSPDFAGDRTLFFYVSTDRDNRILRARLGTGADGTLGDPSVVLDGIPAGQIHDGGRLEFGPEGYLYASTGETGDEPLAQQPDALGGKILRITTDGEPAPGNPDPASPVWTLGHRNVQGLAFDDRGRLWASEFGSDEFDELNRIRPGENYGWPEVEGRGGDGRFAQPDVVWRTSDASPSGLAWREGSLWMASLAGERLWRVDASGARATSPTDFFVGEYGRLRTVVVAPDGRLWVTTSNRDGRGDPAAEDDRILLVEP